MGVIQNVAPGWYPDGYRGKRLTSSRSKVGRKTSQHTFRAVRYGTLPAILTLCRLFRILRTSMFF